MALANFIKERKQKNRKSLLIDNMVFSNGSLISESSIQSKDKIYDDYINTQDNYQEQEIVYLVQEKQHEKTQEKIQEKTKEQHNCDICNNESEVIDNFIILSCSHIFHIKCLADTHLINGIIDEEFLNTRLCIVCNNQIEIEDLLYIHNKFYKNTKEYICKHQETVDKLNKQMSKIKDELRICYESQEKLELQRSKSKQISVTINSLSMNF